MNDAQAVRTWSTLPIGAESAQIWQIEQGRFHAITPVTDSGSSPSKRVIPGFFDIQVNGLAGVDFGNPDISEEDLRLAHQTFWRDGGAYLLATLITAPVDRMKLALSNLVSLRSRDPRLERSMVGFHLEGPFISASDGPRGAHPLAHCKDPNWSEFCELQEAAAGLVKLVTLAPERPGSCEFIEKVVATGVRVAIGHTEASRQQILAAVDAGATLATHLGNAGHHLVQRHDNPILDQLGEDRLWASLIADGHHLPAHVVKIFARAKGLSKLILVSDAVRFAGMEPGVYDAGYRKFELRRDGSVHVVGEPRLAGAGLLLRGDVVNFARFAEVTLAEAIAAASQRPAEFLGLDAEIGSLAVGREASFCVVNLDDSETSFEVVETYLAGERVF